MQVRVDKKIAKQSIGELKIGRQLVCNGHSRCHKYVVLAFLRARKKPSAGLMNMDTRDHDPTNTTHTPHHEGLSRSSVIGIAVGSIIGFMIVLAICWLYRETFVQWITSKLCSSPQSQSSAAFNASHPQQRERNGNDSPTSSTPLMQPSLSNNSDQPSEAHADESVEGQRHLPTELAIGRTMPRPVEDQQLKDQEEKEERSRSTIDNLNTLCKKLLNSEKKFKEKLEEARGTIAEKEVEMDYLTKHIKQLQSEKEDLTNKLDQQKSEHQATEAAQEKNLERKLEEVKSELEDSRRENEQLRLERDAKKKEAAVYFKELEEARVTIAEKEVELKLLQPELAVAQETKAAKDEEGSEVHETVGKMSPDYSPQWGNPPAHVAARAAVRQESIGSGLHVGLPLPTEPEEQGNEKLGEQ